jgi:hypothetical protein
LPVPKKSNYFHPMQRSRFKVAPKGKLASL